MPDLRDDQHPHAAAASIADLLQAAPLELAKQIIPHVDGSIAQRVVALLEDRSTAALIDAGERRRIAQIAEDAAQQLIDEAIPVEKEEEFLHQFVEQLVEQMSVEEANRIHIPIPPIPGTEGLIAQRTRAERAEQEARDLLHVADIARRHFGPAIHYRDNDGYALCNRLDAYDHDSKTTADIDLVTCPDCPAAKAQTEQMHTDAIAENAAAIAAAEDLLNEHADDPNAGPEESE